MLDLSFRKQNSAIVYMEKIYSSSCKNKIIAFFFKNKQGGNDSYIWGRAVLDALWKLIEAASLSLDHKEMV